MKNIRCLTTSIAAIAASTQALWADTLMVPEQYPDIQSAIDASSSGDSIDVGPGTYGRFKIISNQLYDLSIISRAGPSQTFLYEAGEVDDHIIQVSLPNFQESQIHIEGFTIENVTMSAPIEMIKNSLDTIAVFSYSNFTIKNCTAGRNSELIERGRFFNSTFEECRGSLAVATPLTNCTIDRCTCQFTDGETGAILRSVSLLNCTITECDSVYLIDNNAFSTDIDSCIIQNNISSGAIARVASGSTRSTTFANNSGRQLRTRFTYNVINCTFSGNSGADFGTVISAEGSSTDDVFLSGCNITSNTANVGGVVYGFTSDVILIDTTCCDNQPSNFLGTVDISDPTNDINVNCEEEVSCCLPGSCLVLPTSTCADVGGISLTGECNHEDCPNEGACCIAGDCVFTTLETCFDLGGNYAGFGTECASTICEPTCEGDTSGNGVVDFADLIAVLNNWGPCSG